MKAGDSLEAGFLSITLILCMFVSLDPNNVHLAALKVSFKSGKKVDKGNT